MAIESLARVLPRWARWARNAANLETLADADYPFPKPDLKFLGTVVQRYRLKGGTPTEAFRNYFDNLDYAVDTTLLPALRDAELLLSDSAYTDAGLEGSLRLSSIPDFNTLIANSQQSRKPVFTLTQEDVNRRGFVWETRKVNIDNFRVLFKELAERIITLTKP